ncbi:MAG: response regulator [Gloeomargarita sp. SKYBB_i_bin120]|nr:response regulator [Gloeomargarita sp. SKYG98]MCS7291366.1 response regulator [Gloeomargarita sp. SKYB120]MDW8176925.1 response regulator [Gloeomargarita sp. SKYBB_i_bin120]
MTKYKILVIDDSFLIRKSLVEQLSGDRFEVYEAKDGPTGLAKAEEVNPDVILLDFIMPGMNGYDVYQALRANPKFANTPVIIISSSYDEVVSKFGYPFVGFDFLAKQFTKEQLEERINAVLPMIAAAPEHVGIAVTEQVPADHWQRLETRLAELAQQLQQKPAWVAELPAAPDLNPLLAQLQTLEGRLQELYHRPPADTLSPHLQEMTAALTRLEQHFSLEPLHQQIQTLQTQMNALHAQLQTLQLSQDTLNQLVSSLQSLNQGIANLPRTDAVLDQVRALEAKLDQVSRQGPAPNFLLWLGLVTLGALVGAAIGSAVVGGGQRQSQLPSAVPSSISVAVTATRWL